MENEREPLVKDAKRSFRNTFACCLLLGLIGVPISCSLEERALPGWGMVAFGSLAVSVAIVYAFFLAFLAVGWGLLFDRRRPWKFVIFIGALCAAAVLLLAAFSLLIRRSEPSDLSIERIGFFSQLSAWCLLALLIGLTGAACVGWRKHLRSNGD